MQAGAGKLHLTIADSGVGFDVDGLAGRASEPCWGLLTMGERAAAVGGRVEVESAPGCGTRVIVTVDASS